MRTQLYNWHSKNGSLVEFAGFDMPVMFSSIKEEHLAVRNTVGLFDVSHMGRMWIRGKDAEKLLNFLVPRDLSKTQVGRASYTFMLNEQAGFKDDLVFERTERDTWLLIWNAGNLMKIKHWITTFYDFVNFFTHVDVNLIDISKTSAMFALQGPKAINVLRNMFNESINLPDSWGVINTTFNNIELIISGTGYTGEAGYEIIVLNTTNDDPSSAEIIWETLLHNGEDYHIKPCGLGARDTLRLEAGYHLYGNDLNETTDPITAGLFFPPFIHMMKENFIGKTMLELREKNKLGKKRIGIIAMKKGPSPRAGQKLYYEGKEVGIVSSGSFSPLLELGIGMGYVDASVPSDSGILQFEVRGKMYDAQISKFPLFDQKKYGKNRK